MSIGDLVEYEGNPYYVCGLSTMINDQDGEPEWRVTKEVQEVAIVPPFSKGRSHEFHKPIWLPISNLTKQNSLKEGQS